MMTSYVALKKMDLTMMLARHPFHYGYKTEWFGLNVSEIKYWAKEVNFFGTTFISDGHGLMDDKVKAV